MKRIPKTLEEIGWNLKKAAKPIITFDAEVSEVMTEMASDYWPGIKFLQGEKDGDEEKRSL